MGFCMALNMNSVGIPGGFRGSADSGENLGFGAVLGNLGCRKAFAQTERHRNVCLFSRSQASVTLDVCPVTPGYPWDICS